MNMIEVYTIKLVPNVHEVTYDPAGKYVAVMKERKLKVTEFEQENGGNQLSSYILRDELISTQAIHKIVCFPNYLILVMISDINERCLSLLRWDFRKNSTLKLELPFPNHINWKNKRQYINCYGALPANIAEIFQTDYVPFNNKWVTQFFQVDFLVLEQSLVDFQLIGIKGERIHTFLTYKKSRPSPFTTPYFAKYVEEHGLGRITIYRYKEYTVKKFQLLYQRNGYEFCYLNESIYLILGVIEIKMFVKSKMIRKFSTTGLELFEIHQNYLFSNISSGNNRSTQRLDIKNAKTMDIAKYTNAIMRGNYIFYKEEQIKQGPLIYLQGIPFFYQSQIDYLKVLRLK